MRFAIADRCYQCVNRPHAGQSGAKQVAVEQADPFRFVERRKEVVVAQAVAEIRPDTAAEIRSRLVDLEKA